MAALRTALLGSGACAMGDEFRYWYSAQMLVAASKFDLIGTLSPMFDTGGRPGLAIVQLPPILLQSILFKMTNLDPRSVQSLWIPQGWNVGVSLLSAWFFFKNGVRNFNFSERQSAWLTSIFCLLSSSNFYIRHLLPYDFALCFFLLLLYKNSPKTNPVLSGILTAFCYSIYPGYWPLALVLFAFFYVNNQKFTLKKLIFHLSEKKQITRGLWFVLGFVLLLLLYEILAQIAGKSFIENSLFGSHEFLHFLALPFDGSVGLLLDYLWSVEGFGGMLLGVGSAVFLTRTLWSKGSISRLEILAFALLFAFIFQTSWGYFSGMKIFYGRLFKQFMPAMIWMSGAILYSPKAIFFTNLLFFQIRKIVFIIILGIFSIHFLQFWVNFRAVGYPRDVLHDSGFVQKTDGQEYDIRSKTPIKDGLQRVCEFEASSYFTRPPGGFQVFEPIDSGQMAQLYFVNFGSFPTPIRDDFHFFEPAKLGRWLVSKPHFGQFIPYIFEEDVANRRVFFKNKTVKIGIYSIQN